MMKYIVAEVAGLPTLFVFSELVTHANMAEMVGYGNLNRAKVRGAGFISPMLEVYGESVSLGIKVHPDDQELVDRHFKGSF